MNSPWIICEQSLNNLWTAPRCLYEGPWVTIEWHISALCGNEGWWTVEWCDLQWSQTFCLPEAMSFLKITLISIKLVIPDLFMLKTQPIINYCLHEMKTPVIFPLHVKIMKMNLWEYKTVSSEKYKFLWPPVHCTLQADRPMSNLVRAFIKTMAYS